MENCEPSDKYQDPSWNRILTTLLTLFTLMGCSLNAGSSEDPNNTSSPHPASLKSLVQLLGKEERVVEELLGPPDRLKTWEQKGASARSYLARGIMVDCSGGRVDSISLLGKGAINDGEDWHEFRGEILTGLSLGMSAEATEKALGPPNMKHKDQASGWRREQYNITASYDSGRVIAFVVSVPTHAKGAEKTDSPK